MKSLFNWLFCGNSTNIDEQDEFIAPASPAEQVLQNEMLLDKILNFAILDGDTINMETANSCKLVQHLWLERVTASLKPYQSHPVYIDAELRWVKMIRFVHAFENSTIDRTPLFNLRIAANSYYTKKEGLKTCMKCFTRCGHAMEELTMDFDNGMWLSNFNPPISVPLWLPRLHTIKIRLFPGDEKPRKIDRFIQWILNSCETLECLSIEQIHDGGRYALDMKKLVLPQSLIDLRLFDVEDTNIFSGKNDFIHLYCLTLNLCMRRFNIERQIYPILHRFRHQLKELDLSDTDLEEEDAASTPAVLMPHMEILEELSCDTIGLTWPERVSSLNAFFPALRRIILSNQPYEHLRKCIEGVTFISVRGVHVDLTMGERGCIQNFDANLILQQLQRLKAAFPNVTELIVKFPYTNQMPPVNYIFEEMRQLQKLDIRVRTGSKNEDYFLTALLLGISLEEVASIQERRINWSVLRNYGQRESSILQMRELKEFRIFDVGGGYGEDVSLIDIIFELTFLRMTNLKTLSFSGSFSKFKPSTEVAKKWTGKGGILKT